MGGIKRTQVQDNSCTYCRHYADCRWVVVRHRELAEERFDLQVSEELYAHKLRTSHTVKAATCKDYEIGRRWVLVPKPEEDA